MGKSILYAANTVSQTVEAGTAIDFGSIVRRCGCNCNITNGNVALTGAGFYDIDTNILFTSSATAGTATVTLYQDGTAIPGAVASITTAASTTYQVSIPAVVRNYRSCCCGSTITAVVTGQTVTVNTATVTVEKE